MDSADRDLLTATINDIVASVDGADLTSALDEFGWSDLLEKEEELAISILFSALGRFDHWSSALHDVMARKLTGLPSSEGLSCSVIVPLPRRLTTGNVSGATLHVEGLLLQPRPEPWSVVVVQEEGDYKVLAVPTESLLVENREGVDPQMGASIVVGDCGSSLVLAEGVESTKWWNATVAMARLSICYSIVTLLERMLELATDHASSRRQFGRPIGSFQAVRHRLAESLVATDAARAIVSEVWRSDNVELASAVAKLVSSNAVKVVCAHVQQVLAGIGFTTEHEFHRYMKRAIVLDRLFHNGTELAGAIGGELVSIGYAPRLFEL